MERLIQDLRYGVRVLLRSPVFSVVAILTLGLGIGANTAVFSVFNALLQVPFRVGNPDRVVVIRSQNAGQNVGQAGVSAPDFADWRERNRSFDQLAAGVAVSYNFSDGGEPVWVQAFRFSAGFLPLMGTAPAQGRGFERSDELPGAEPVAIVSHSFWKQSLGAAPGTVGRRVLLDGRPHTIVGIAAEGYSFPQPTTALWTVLPVAADGLARTRRNLLVLGSLKDGLRLDDARQDLAAISRELEETFPSTNRGWSVTLQTFRENVLAGTRLSQHILYTAILFVLLITCANVAGLLMARAASRAPEIALRTALGAGRQRLLRQLLTESLLLAFLGGCLGLLLGVWWMQLLKAMFEVNPQMVSLTSFMKLDQGMLLHTLAMSSGAGILFGVIPALQISKTDLQGVIKEGGRGAQSTRERHRLRGSLVVLQMALALTLLTTTTMLVRSLGQMWAASPGFDIRNLIIFRVVLPSSAYPEPGQGVRFFERAVEILSELPGVVEAAATSRLPAGVFSANPTTPVTIEGAANPEQNQAPEIIDVTASPDYLKTLGLKIVAGRDLERGDNQQALKVAVVNRAFVRRFWPDSNPIGKRFKVGPVDPEAPWLSVVGVTEDILDISPNLRQPNLSFPYAFVPLAQRPLRGMSLIVRTSRNPAESFAAVRQGIRQLDPNQAIFGLMTLEESLEQQRAGARTLLRILGALSVLALMLAAVGLYGIISYLVNQRRHTIGIRLALGARPSDVLRMFLRQGAGLAAIGVLLGLGMALGLARMIKSQLDGLSSAEASDPLTFAGVALLLFLVVLAATFIPARRAMQVNPVETLRGGNG